jgi:hypothetical protein
MQAASADHPALVTTGAWQSSPGSRASSPQAREGLSALSSDPEDANDALLPPRPRRVPQTGASKVGKMLGQGATQSSGFEQIIAILKPQIVQGIAAAADSCALLLADGSVVDFSGRGATPKPVDFPPHAGRVVAVSAGLQHYVALTDRVLMNTYSWGSKNTDGARAVAAAGGGLTLAALRAQTGQLGRAEGPWMSPGYVCSGAGD